MRLEELYLRAVAERAAASTAVEVSPSLMCQACVDVLPVDGAGISLTHRSLRVPLGSSSRSVATAEGAQTTVGAGPCLSAAAEGRALAADATAIAAQWPVYWGELFRLTPFRSVASVPLRLDDEPAFGALNLYASASDLSATLELPEVAADVAGPMARMLSGAFDQLYTDDFDVPEWLSKEPAVDRIGVWTAVGMLVAATGQADVDALATLRGFAYGRGRSLDEVATSLVNRDTPVEALLADA